MVDLCNRCCSLPFRCITEHMIIFLTCNDSSSPVRWTRRLGPGAKDAVETMASQWGRTHVWWTYKIWRFNEWSLGVQAHHFNKSPAAFNKAPFQGDNLRPWAVKSKSEEGRKIFWEFCLHAARTDALGWEFEGGWRAKTRLTDSVIYRSFSSNVAQNTDFCLSSAAECRWSTIPAWIEKNEALCKIMSPQW